MRSKPQYTPEQLRAKNYRRRTARRTYDLTQADERAMRAKAKRCPLCDVKYTAEPYLPNSKELDHIVPVVMGGTHTHGNCRIICRRCNQQRPKDGSDFAGQVTLWSSEPGIRQRSCGSDACRLARVRDNWKTYTRPRSTPHRPCACGQPRSHHPRTGRLTTKCEACWKQAESRLPSNPSA